MKLKDIVKLCGLIKEIKVRINDSYKDEEMSLLSILKNENLYSKIKEATVEGLDVEDNVLVILIEEKTYY